MERLLDAVKRRILVSQVSQQWTVAERLSGNLTAQLRGPVALPLTVHFLVQPTLQAPELAAAEVGVEIGEILSRLLHELGRVQVAEGVGWEITEPAHTPVDVLKAAERIGWRLEGKRM